MDEWLPLLAAGALAGAMNAMAGGGSFVSLPALIGAGLPSVEANATSTVALYPGSLASIAVYRGSLRGVAGVPLRPTLAVTVVGGLLGALLLLWTPSTVFDRLLPWLLVLATLALAFGRRIGGALRERVRIGVGPVLGIQFLLGVYAGYFGGAVGLMMLAVWSLLDGAEIKTLSSARVLLVTAGNTVAVICFAVAGAVFWPEALAVALGAVGGGFGGAVLAKRLPAAVIRIGTISLAILTTAAFFLRAYA